MGKLAMKHDLPPLNWLRSFEAAARHLSFTQAAGELGLTQVAVSKQIKQLEAHLRDQLFIRHPRSLELTKTAEAYLPKVRDAFGRLANGTQEVFGGRRSRVLTVRSAVGFSVNWLAPRLADFHKVHPDIALRLISSVWNEQTGSDHFDLDIRYGMGNWPGMRSDRLTWETITPVCSPDLVAHGNLKLPQDLDNYVLIHVLGYEEGWAKWLQAAGASNFRVGRDIQVDTSLLAFELARAGAGIALARSSLAEREITQGRLVCPFDLNVPIDEAFHLVNREEAFEHKDAVVFRDWVLEQVE